jgi:hypothetical protein
MKTALALATVLATSVVGLGATAAPAAAAACTASVQGFHISGMRLHHGTSCDHAKQVVHHALRNEASRIGWRCHIDSYAHHRFFVFSCWATNDSGHWVTFDVMYADATGANE